jgi:hypothetical protein
MAARFRRAARDRRILNALRQKGQRGTFTAVARRFRLHRATVVRIAKRGAQLEAVTRP